MSEGPSQHPSPGTAPADVLAVFRFTGQDAVEETLRVMQPLLETPPPVHPYAQGSMGPGAGDSLVAGNGRWHEPWMAT